MMIRPTFHSWCHKIPRISLNGPHGKILYGRTLVNILCKISCPIATGRSKRLYNVNRQTIDFIGDMFAAFHSGK